MKNIPLVQTKQFSWLKAILLSFIFIALIGANSWGTTYYSRNNFNPSTLTNWNSNSSGSGGSTPANFTTNGDIFIIQSSHTMVTSSNWTIGNGLSGNVVTLQIEGNLNIGGNKDAVSITANSVIIFNSNNQVIMSSTGNGTSFILSANATLKTINTSGIQGLGCSLPVSTSKVIVTLDPGANYEFNGALQSTLGLPATINNLTISGSGTKTAVATFTVTTTLTIASSVTLNMATYPLSGSSLTTSGTGTLLTQNTTTTPVPAGRSWSFKIEYNANNPQTVLSGTYTDLALSGTGTKTTSAAITVTNALAVATGVTLDMVTNALSGVSLTTSGTGTLLTQNTSATPVPAGRSWSFKVEYNANNPQTVLSGTYTDLTLSGTGTKTSAAANTVTNALTIANGVNLDMATYVLSGVATTSGTGTLLTQNTSATPVPAGRSWSFKVEYNANAGQTVLSGTYTSLTLSGTGTKTLEGITTATASLTVSSTFDLKAFDMTAGDINGGGTITNSGATSALLTTGTSNASTSFLGVIQNGISTIALTKTGSGTLSLSGANTYTGLTTITSGTIRYGASNVLSSGDVLINGGSLNILAFTDVVGAVTLNNGSIEGTGTLTATAYAMQSGTVSSAIAGTAGLTKTTAALVTLTGPQTYTGTTTLTAGELRLNPAANIAPASQYVLNAGTLSTTAITAGRTISSSSTLKLDDNSALVLGSNSHSLTFASSNGITWITGKILTITGWTGAYNGTAGTAGKIFIGSTSAGLTGAQLGQIRFKDGSNKLYNATLLSNGELAPLAEIKISVADGSWYTPGTWDPASVPTSLENVEIAHAVVIDGGSTALCSNLTINSGKSLTINAGNELTVSGTLSNNAGTSGLVIKSNSSATGSLIHNTASIDATVERYIAAAIWTDWKDGWHFLSSPVADQVISPEFVASYVLGNDDFYKWNEPTNQWINIKNSNGTGWTAGFETSFVVGRGYLVAYQATDTKEFKGKLNIANILYEDLSISSGANYSWHLLGNPFPSSLIWDNSTDWEKKNIGGVANIWNESAQGYSPLNEGDIIPACNGFMVKAANSDNALTIPASKRYHKVAGWYKKTSYPVISLFAKNTTNNQSYQESQVRVNPASTTGMDLEYDGNFIPGYAPQFYSVLGTDNLIVNSIPELLPTTVIPFDFIKNEGTNFAIEAQFTALPGTTTVWLKDKKTGTDHNLTSNPVYNFTADAGDDPHRFELHFFAAQWTGATSSSWTENNNWNGGVPLSSSTITINPAPNMPVISTTEEVYALTISNGASLTINDNGALTVTNNLTNLSGNTGLVVKSGGSIISLGTVTGPATVDRAIPANQWHLVSSPVAGALSGMFTSQYLQTHDEASKSYTDIPGTTDPLSVMKGYAVFTYETNYTAHFAGTLSTGNIGSANNLTRSGADDPDPLIDLYGWNLVGNPYASSVDWTLSSGWTKSNVDNATYIHVDNATWATFVGGVGNNSGSQYIAPGQGFFVHVPDGGGSYPLYGTLNINNNARVHHATTFFKNSEDVIPNLLRLEVSGNGYKDEAVVRFLPEATPSFDGEYDAFKLFGDVAESAQLYTLGASSLAINTLPETSVVPAGLRAGVSGTYTIAATEINDLQYVTLEDTKTGMFTELAVKPYTFHFTTGENEQRFKLHFSALSVPDPQTAATHIYSYQKTIYVNLNDQAKGNIFIYNVSGQLVKTTQGVNGINEIKLPDIGIYMVKVITGKATVVEKVYIQ